MTPETLRAALPPLDGTLRVAGLSDAVEVFRDPEGIPHIRARGQHDAFLAQGFVHAQDRLFQMELNLRRKALGRSRGMARRARRRDADVLVPAPRHGELPAGATIAALSAPRRGGCSIAYVGGGECLPRIPARRRRYEYDLLRRRRRCAGQPWHPHRR
jgi:hypothetical protein